MAECIFDVLFKFCVASKFKHEFSLFSVLVISILQYKNDLENDEEIFVEKSKMVEIYKLKIEELEEERARLVLELEKYSEIGKQKERQMFEQQLRIQKMENELGRFSSGGKGKIFD